VYSETRPGVCRDWKSRGCRGWVHSHYSDGIVIENGRDVFRGKLVRGVADEKAGFADGTVTDDHAPTEGQDVSEQSI
jgi:hypothetical protein